MISSHEFLHINGFDCDTSIILIFQIRDVNFIFNLLEVDDNFYCIFICFNRNSFQDIL